MNNERELEIRNTFIETLTILLFQQKFPNIVQILFSL